MKRQRAGQLSGLATLAAVVAFVAAAVAKVSRRIADDIAAQPVEDEPKAPDGSPSDAGEQNE